MFLYTEKLNSQVLNEHLHDRHTEGWKIIRKGWLSADTLPFWSLNHHFHTKYSQLLTFLGINMS